MYSDLVVLGFVGGKFLLIFLMINYFNSKYVKLFVYYEIKFDLLVMIVLLNRSK